MTMRDINAAAEQMRRMHDQMVRITSLSAHLSEHFAAVRAFTTSPAFQSMVERHGQANRSLNASWRTPWFWTQTLKQTLTSRWQPFNQLFTNALLSFRVEQSRERACFSFGLHCSFL